MGYEDRPASSRKNSIRCGTLTVIAPSSTPAGTMCRLSIRTSWPMVNGRLMTLWFSAASVDGSTPNFDARVLHVSPLSTVYIVTEPVRFGGGSANAAETIESEAAIESASIRDG